MKKVFFLVSLGLLLGLGLNAQSKKLGYLNSNELLTLLPDYKKIGDEMQAYQATFVDQSKAMRAEFAEKYTAYTSTDPKTMTDAIRQVKEKELTDLEARINDFEQSATEKVNAKNEELISPLFDRIKKAIDEVAKENNYDYIFDAQGILFAKDSENILPLLKTKLGVK